jgi:hypothetical protein
MLEDISSVLGVRTFFCERSNWFEDIAKKSSEQIEEVVKARSEDLNIYQTLYSAPLFPIECDWPKDRILKLFTAQTFLGLSLRYFDSLIDGDGNDSSVKRLAMAMKCVAGAADVLDMYSPLDDPILWDFLQYEEDVAAEWDHDYNTIWRRVSPLCSLVRQGLFGLGFDQQRLWREYLGWMLLFADCEDALDDWSQKRRTPVIAIALEHGGQFATADSLSFAVRSVRSALQKHANRIVFHSSTSISFIISLYAQKLTNA